jgi:hypothetical protein
MKITAAHIKLLKELMWEMSDVEYGAPCVDPKRPYGNSSVAFDIAEILGWKIEEEGITDEQIEEAAAIHAELLPIIKHMCKNCSALEGTEIKVKNA